MSQTFSWQKSKQQEPIDAGKFSWSNPTVTNLVKMGAERNQQKERESTIRGRFSTLIGNTVAGSKEGWSSVPVAPKKLSTFPTNVDTAATTGVTSWKETIEDASKRYGTFGKAWTSPSTATEKAVSSGEAALGVVNTFFAPVNSALQLFSAAPVVGHVADKVSQIFGAIAGGGSAYAITILDGMDISQEKKDRMRPLIGELGGLTSMMVAGKMSGDVVGKARKTTSQLLQEVKNTPQDIRNFAGALDRTPGIGTNAPIKLPVKRAPTNVPVTDIGMVRTPQIRQGYDPYIPDSQLPVIQAGKGKALTGRNSVTKEGSLTIEPIKPEKFSWNKPAAEKPAVVAEKTNGVPDPSKGRPKGSEFQSKTQLDLVKDARAMGMEVTDPAFQKSRIKAEDYAKADDFVARDLAKAERVAKGEIKPPSNILREDVYTALEAYALKKGDVELVQRLSSMTVGTEAGQRFQALNRRPDTETYKSPVEHIRDIETARMEKVTNKAKQEAENIASKTEPIKPPKAKDWYEFIGSLPIC